MITSHIALVLLISGIVTMAGGLVFLYPHASMRIVFAVETSDKAVMTVTRHWGLLLFLVGGLLVYAAYNPSSRLPIVVAACVEKIAIISLFFAERLKWTAALRAIVAIDGLFALLYLAYFFTR